MVTAAAMIRLRSVAAALILGAIPVPAAPAPNTCGSFLSLGYEARKSFAVPGDTARVTLTFGSGSVQGGTKVTLSRIRFELDCDVSGPLGLGCTDDGAVIAYGGDATITTNCTATPGGQLVSLTTGHPAETSPKQVVFTPSTPIDVPRNTPNYCSLSFGVIVAGRSSDATPNQVEQVAGYSVVSGDAVCDNGLSSSASQSGAIPLCPDCSVGLCAASCNQDTGACLPVSACDDGDACTIDTCDAATGCVHAAVACADANACTVDACDPQAGCVHDASAADGQPCDDGCTSTLGERCAAGVCALPPPDADRDGDGWADAFEDLAGCSADDPAEVPAQAPRGDGGGGLLARAAPAATDVTVATDAACATAGTCGPRGFCTAGHVADACRTDGDCNQAARTCRVVVSLAAGHDVQLVAASLNGVPVTGFTSATPGCSRKVDVVLDPARRASRLRLEATGTFDGQPVRDVDRLVFR
jgi:hypothetical protein